MGRLIGRIPWFQAADISHAKDAVPSDLGPLQERENISDDSITIGTSRSNTTLPAESRSLVVSVEG